MNTIKNAILFVLPNLALAALSWYLVFNLGPSFTLIFFFASAIANTAFTIKGLIEFSKFKS